MTGVPPRQGERIGWAALPEWLQAEVGSLLGSPVVAAEERPGGFSPGAALGLTTASGRRAFLKAVSGAQNEDTVAVYREEARVHAWLPDGLPVPRLLCSVDRDGWIALVFEYADGRLPHLPWQDAELELVLDAVRRVHRRLTPAPVAAMGIDDRYGDEFTGWRLLAAAPEAGADLDPWSRRHLARLAELEAGWAEAAAGDTLLHTDLRHDNVLVARDQAWIVDWNWVCRGAAFVDVAFFAPTVVGHGGPLPDDVLSRGAPGTPVARLAPVVAAVAGFWTHRSLLPAPPGLPYLRGHQAASGRAAREWLGRLLELD